MHAPRSFTSPVKSLPPGEEEREVGKTMERLRAKGIYGVCVCAQAAAAAPLACASALAAVCVMWDAMG